MATFRSLLVFLMVAATRAEDDYAAGYGAGDGAAPYGNDEYNGDNYGQGDPPPPPEPKKLEDEAALQTFLNDEPTEPAVVGFFNEETNKADVEAFLATAEQNAYEMRWAMATNEEMRTKFKASSGCVVHVYKPPKFVSDKLEKPKARFPGKAVEAKALAKFAKKSSLPLVGQKTWKSNERYESAGVPVVTLFADVDLDKNFKQFEYYANRMRKVAVEFAGKLVFNIADKSDFSYLAEDYGLALPEKKDLGVGIKDGAAHYGLSETFSVDALKAFCVQMLDGSLTPLVKEEQEPASYGGEEEEEEDDGTPSAVATVTPENFEEVVMAPGKDVMIEFYAPWCGHCKQLKPTYKKLADRFAGDASVTVAAMDASEAAVPEGFDVQGYPTIMFVPAATKKPVSYDGPRDVESMADYIKTHAAAAAAPADEL